MSLVRDEHFRSKIRFIEDVGLPEVEDDGPRRLATGLSQ